MISKKRGQVTIFIIIGILIVAGVVLFFILKEDSSEGEIEPIEVNPEIEPVYSYVDSCLDSSSKEVVYAVGTGGGYYDIEEEKSTEDLGVTYHLIDSRNIMLSEKEIEKEISENIEIKTENCSSDLDSKFSDYQVRQKNMSVETTIKQEEILIEADYPLLIKKGESVYEVRKFRKKIPVRLGEIHEAVDEFIEEEVDSSEEGICVSCMSEIASDYSLDFNLIQIDEEGKEYLFMVTEAQEEINNETFMYSFANKY